MWGGCPACQPSPPNSPLRSPPCRIPAPHLSLPQGPPRSPLRSLAGLLFSPRATAASRGGGGGGGRTAPPSPITECWRLRKVEGQRGTNRAMDFGAAAWPGIAKRALGGGAQEQLFGDPPAAQLDGGLQEPWGKGVLRHQQSSSGGGGLAASKANRAFPPPREKRIYPG